MSKANSQVQEEIQYTDDGIPYPTEGQLKSIIRRWGWRIDPALGGWGPGEYTLRDGTKVIAKEAGTETPEDIYFSEQRKKLHLKDDALKGYEYQVMKYGRDINAGSGYRAQETWKASRCS